MGILPENVLCRPFKPKDEAKNVNDSGFDGDDPFVIKVESEEQLSARDSDQS